MNVLPEIGSDKLTLDESGLLVEDSIKALKDIGVQVLHYHIGGSVAINGEGNDIDIIVLTAQPISEITDMCKPVFELCGEESYESQGQFVAFRYGDVNIFVPASAELYNLWRIALEMCQWLTTKGFRDRDTRVAVHQIVVDGGLRE